MPVVATGTVLVTGANGYIAMWVVRTLLQAGYSVRGTVRSEGKAKHLRQVFASYGNKLEILIVEDITRQGAFDEAVKGVDAIEHTASPFHFKADDPEELIVPAVQGTTRILESALANGTTVKRVVVTSSTASVMHPQDTPRAFSELDWNDAAINEVKEKGRGASQPAKYRASKTLAERAAWEFVEKNKGATGWDLVVLNPPYVFGPATQEVGAPEALNESMLDWFHSVFKGSRDAKQLSAVGSSWIDVRDLADAHLLALQKEEAGGERIIISEGVFKWQDFVNAARKYGAKIPEGDTSYDIKTATHDIMYDTSKAARLLGLKYHSIEQSTKDIMDDFKARHWIP
ncbi:NAD(P)-binding protein [Laetiporus sulphureus 93-53]|uniref:NAD(P)-binding protein n=1 Tax=Laetiporus sulphureus 93-53 TaxID=1314785 RepID=A0A165CDB9_9APHY|nr:NAD(P)-binding protein [Laetiporus sulphureus 93-53]KZT02608.1 NAD(P)-binding protein [Laetiporus sulphureus 93-53]